jgi:hypothetical protein
MPLQAAAADLLSPALGFFTAEQTMLAALHGFILSARGKLCRKTCVSDTPPPGRR